MVKCIKHILPSSTNISGRPYAIRAGRPIYRAAFQRLVNDAGLSAKMEINILTTLTKAETDSIQRLETELMNISAINAYSKKQELYERAQYLMKKIQKSQALIDGYEAKITEMKDVLSKNY